MTRSKYADREVRAGGRGLRMILEVRRYGKSLLLDDISTFCTEGTESVPVPTRLSQSSQMLRIIKNWVLCLNILCQFFKKEYDVTHIAALSEPRFTLKFF